MSQNQETEIEIELLTYIIKNIVDSPDEIRIQRDESERWILLTLTAWVWDISRIIWKEWRVAWAIRVLLKVVWARMDKRINLRIVEPHLFWVTPPNAE